MKSLAIHERLSTQESILSIRQRFPKGTRWSWHLVKRWLGISAAQTALESLEGLEGHAFVNGALRYLRIRTDCTNSSGETLPLKGPVLIVANHHFGAADALLALSLFLPRRPDIKILGNNFLTILPQLSSLIIPVAPPSMKRRRLDGIREVIRHLEAGKALLVFPSGQVASLNRTGAAEDGSWLPGIGRLIHKFHLDVVPVTFEGQNSRLFYFSRSIHFRFGTLLLLRELLNKTGRCIRVHIGNRIPYDFLAHSTDPLATMENLRSITYEQLDRSKTAITSRSLLDVSDE